jgi:hypothetical protein
MVVVALLLTVLVVLAAVMFVRLVRSGRRLTAAASDRLRSPAAAGEWSWPARPRDPMWWSGSVTERLHAAGCSEGAVLWWWRRERVELGGLSPRQYGLELGARAGVVLIALADSDARSLESEGRTPGVARARVGSGRPVAGPAAVGHDTLSSGGGRRV